MFDQLKMKEEEKDDVLKEIEFKNNRIHELEEILEAKDIPYTSRVSRNSRIR